MFDYHQREREVGFLGRFFLFEISRSGHLTAWKRSSESRRNCIECHSTVIATFPSRYFLSWLPTFDTRFVTNPFRMNKFFFALLRMRVKKIVENATGGFPFRNARSAFCLSDKTCCPAKKKSPDGEIRY